MSPEFKYERSLPTSIFAGETMSGTSNARFPSRTERTDPPEPSCG
jgi:hypothetical protein